MAAYRLLLWIAVFLALGELALELRARARGYETLLFGEAANARVDPDGEFGRTPDFPFRSRRTSPAKPEGTTRIWIASASYAEDVTEDPADIWPVLLEDELRARGFEVEVLNDGRAGIGIPGSVRQLREIGAEWEPDLVLCYHLSNDIDGAVNRFLAEVEETETLPEPTADERPWPTRIAQETTLFTQATNLIGTRVGDLRPKLQSAPEALEQRLEWDLRALEAATEALEAELVLTTFALGIPDPASPLPPTWVRLLALTNPRLDPVGWRLAAARGNALVQRLAGLDDPLGTALIDLDLALSGRRELFDDSFHFSHSGHPEVARILADGLEPLLRRRAEGGSR